MHITCTKPDIERSVEVERAAAAAASSAGGCIDFAAMSGITSLESSARHEKQCTKMVIYCSALFWILDLSAAAVYIFLKPPFGDERR